MRKIETRRADFVAILAPQAQILRPVTDAGRYFIQTAYADVPKGIGNAVAFGLGVGATPLADSFEDALDKLSAAGLRIELL